MELKEWKERTRTTTAPRGIGTEHGSATDHLVRALQEADVKQAKQLKKTQPFLIVAAICYALVFAVIGLLPGEDIPWSRPALMGLLTFIFLLQLMFVTRQRASLARLDYSAPVRQFLADAQERFGLMHSRDLLFAIPLLLLLGVVGGAHVVDVYAHRDPSVDHTGLVLSIYIPFFVLVCAAGIFFTYRDWRNDRRELYRRIKEMRTDLDSDESDAPNGSVAKD